MRRLLLALLIVLACGSSGTALAAESHPEDFAYGMQIKTPIAGTAYRLTLPVEVFMKVSYEDLRDVRVFNARGDVVPYELRQTLVKPMGRPTGPSLPLYPLHGDAGASLRGLRVTIHSEGTAVDLQAAGAVPDPRVITSYVVDARQIAQPLSGLQLQWADGAPEFSGSLRIESSDDLASWRVVKDETAVVHLLTGGSELVQSHLTFPSTEGKFYRLTWVGKTAPFELVGITAEPALGQPLPPQSTVTASGSRVANKENEISFDLGAKLPINDVNVVLPQLNSVVKMELLSRARPIDPWRLVTQGEFYRVSGGTSDINNEPIRIPTDSDRFWLVRQAQPTGPVGDVKFQGAWDAIDVVFLAQGTAPYQLAYGNASASPAGVTLAPLIKGVTVVAAETGPSYVLGGIERLRLAPRTVPWRMAALWSALGLGVLVLGWMSYRLSRELRTQPTL